jgi:hypothetical protein
MSTLTTVVGGLLALVVYFLISRFATLFTMNGFKKEEEIISLNKDKAHSKFKVKYPEADINTSKNMAMALLLFLLLVRLFLLSTMQTNLLK